jgi:tetratricopeptide (TPR) repeat protein
MRIGIDSTRLRAGVVIIGLMVFSSITVAQNIKFEDLSIRAYRYPLKPLDKSVKTYSVSLQDLNANLSNDMRDTLMRSMVLPGYEKVKAGGDVQLELVISPLTITAKEVKDQPVEQKDAPTLHQFWYEIRYVFPAKMRMANKAQTINESDIPGSFTTEYYPEDRSSQTALQRAYDNDFYFINGLKYKRVGELRSELRGMLADRYGYGMVNEMIEIAYIAKDKKEEYADLNKAMSILHEAFTYAGNKKEYLDDFFKSKINDAIVIYEKELLESSDDKKARIDPFVTGMIYYSLSLAYYGLQEFDKAVDIHAKIKAAGRNDGSVYNHVLRSIADKRARLAANGLMKGGVANVEAVSPALPQREDTSPKDYVIGLRKDTVFVQLIMPSKEVMPLGDSLWLQDQVFVVKGSENIQLLPGEIQGYSYGGVYRESTTYLEDMKTQPWTYSKKFCKRTLQGAISMFRCYKSVPGFRDPTRLVVESRMWYKKDGEPQTVGFLNFKKEVAKLVEDYPELSEKLKAGAYERDDFEKIVHEYNQWKKTKM